MSDVTQILQQIEAGDPSAAEHLLPLVYEELRKLAAARMANESPDHTLQATALVHEAYIRLVDTDRAQHWESRGHFFAAAAEAMRRILVDQARRKLRIKHGGELNRVDLNDADLATNLPPDEFLLLNDAIDALGQHDLNAAKLLELRYFAGLTIDDAAAAIGVPRTTAYRHWTYACAWLTARIRPSSESS